MSSIFNWVLFAHIIFAIIWVGSAVVLEILEWEAVHTSKREHLAATLHRSSWFGARVFAPSAVFTLITGIIAVAVGKPTFSQAWVIIALVAVVVVSALGGGVIGRKSAQLAARLDDPAVSEGEVERGLMGIRWAVYLDLAILFFIVFDMVMHPATLDPAFLVVSGAFFVVVIAAIAVNQVKLNRLSLVQ
jgi:uncharacterized membrane protein